MGPDRIGRAPGRRTRHPGLRLFFQRAAWLWAGIFLLLTASLAALMETEPAGTFMDFTPA